MEDLEKAILISFDESGAVNSALKSQAISYCQRIKEVPSICSICIECLCCSKLVQVQFWCLQNLHEGIQMRYESMASEEKSSIRNSVLSMACSGTFGEEKSVKVIGGTVFIKNKLAQVFVTLICIEYPLVWPSVFIDILPHLTKGGVVIDMFCRIMNALDDELISLEYPRSSEELIVACRVKDAMRQQCITQIVGAWYDIVCCYKESEPELSTVVLDTMRRYISWIDIGLVANDVIMPLLFQFILAEGLLESLRGSAVGCVLAIVSKRMDPLEKILLLTSIQINRVFGLIRKDADPQFVSRTAMLLIGFAVEALDCSKRVSSEESRRSAVELLNQVMPSVFYVVQNCAVDSAFNTVQFLSSYIATMKNKSLLGDSELLHVRQILEVIRQRIVYEPMYRINLDTFDKVGKEEEDRMVEVRKDLFVLLRNVGRVVPDVTLMFIRSTLTSATASNAVNNVEEIEAALSLLHALGESMSDEIMKNENRLLTELVVMVLSTRFPCHTNRLVALVYLETVTRYLKLIQDSGQYIPMALSAFLDERGIHNPNVNVKRRASYLFLRVVKLLKSKLVPFIETILLSLQDTVSQFTGTTYSSKVHSGCEDGTHIFEAIGILIGMEEVPVEKQSEYLSALLNPLSQQVKVLLVSTRGHYQEDFAAKIANIQQIVMEINALSKGFSERLVTAARPTIGLMFKQTLDVLLQILVIFPKIEPLRSKVTSFIHRMVDTLGVLVFPYLPKALEQLLVQSEPRELVGFLVLINQLICKFNLAVHDIVEEIFPIVADKVFRMLPSDVTAFGPVSNVEELRELQELQKTLFTFLHVMATHDLSSVFLSPGSRGYLYPMMQLLLHTSCNHKDILVRKACVQIFIRLIKDWCSRTCGEEKVPGFQNFIIEAFATNCCLYSVLDKSFQLHDANNLVLVGEIVMAQKVMYEKFGDEFLVHFVRKGFPNAYHTQDLAQEYRKKLQGSDMKGLKSFYQSLIENLRVEDNQSLVFR